MIAGVTPKPKLSLDKTIPLNTNSSATGVIIPKSILTKIKMRNFVILIVGVTLYLETRHG